MKKIVHQQQGQIIILGVFFIALILVVTLTLFNTTQNEFTRQNATNIADAAVYSGLQHQAKSLNYLAYTNRAIIANHVAVGQIVSTSSWLDYVAATSQQIAIIAQLIPYVGAIISRGAEVVAQGAEAGIEALPALVEASEQAVQVLRESQQPVYRITGPETAIVINDIIRKNDTRFSVTHLGLTWISKNLRQWQQFTDEFSSAEAMQRQATTISSALGSWTKRRNRNEEPAREIIRFKKRGTTRLLHVETNNGSDQWVWESRDAASFFQRTIKFRWGVPKIYWKEIPLVTGATHGTEIVDDTQNQRWLNDLFQSERYARSNTNTISSSYSGLHAYRDLRGSQNSGPENAHQEAQLSLALEIATEREQIRTTDQIDGLGAAESNTHSTFHVKPLSGNIASISKGRLFFQRSYRRQDGTTEYANLFNPFWTVRLTPHDNEQRQAWGSRSLVRPF